MCWRRTDWLSHHLPPFAILSEAKGQCTRAHCDNLVSVRKTDLTQFIGALPPVKLAALNQALKMALDLD